MEYTKIGAMVICGHEMHPSCFAIRLRSQSVMPRPPFRTLPFERRIDKIIPESCTVASLISRN